MLKIFLHLMVIVLLTVVSQIGGLVYLLCLLSNNWMRSKKWPWPARIFIFVAGYLFISQGIVPLIAKPLGRVPLPVFGSESAIVRPHSVFYPLLNRHYVRPELKDALLEVGTRVQKHYPDATIRYLDGSFPFIEDFRLLPHRGHDDGRRVDICFLYTADGTGKQAAAGNPRWLGYGYVEEPAAGEIDLPAQCARKGRWQYSILAKWIEQDRPGDPTWDKAANQLLVGSLIANPDIRKIFIEPHLSQRLGWEGHPEVRFHGCWAVRHDDHIHVQL